MIVKCIWPFAKLRTSRLLFLTKTSVHILYEWTSEQCSNMHTVLKLMGLYFYMGWNEVANYLKG